MQERFSLLRSRSKGTLCKGHWIGLGFVKAVGQSCIVADSVFHGGFEINAAEDVLHCGEWKGLQRSLMCSKICAKFTAAAKQIGGWRDRFGLLSTICQYARESSRTTTASRRPVRSAGQQRHRVAPCPALFSIGGKAFWRNWTTVKPRTIGDNSSRPLIYTGTEYGSGDVALQCCLAALRPGMKGLVSLGVDIAGEVLDKPDIPTAPRSSFAS